MPWASFPGPEHYRPEQVPRALRALAAARDPQSARDAYEAVLFAMGNNHAGTLYPAAPAVAPFLLWIALRGTPCARWAALEVLLDALSFAPEPRYETTPREGREPQRVDAAMHEAVDAAAEALFALLENPAEEESLRVGALEVLDALERHDARLRDALTHAPLPPPAYAWLSRCRGQPGAFAFARERWLAAHPAPP